MFLETNARTGLHRALLVMMAAMLLLAVMPTFSQNAATQASAASVEVITDNTQRTVWGFVAFLLGQILLLWAAMMSYLYFSAKASEERHMPNHHWWHRLHLHHR